MSSAPDPFDSLEAELAAMRPAAPSDELFAAVERRLARPPATPSAWYWVGAAVAAAACAVVATALWHATQDASPRPLVSVATTVTTGAAGDDRPALASYHRALSLPAGELDELLDRHAARALAGGGSAGSARVTAQSGLVP